MRILISILAAVNGAYMLLDGIVVLIKGKYIGPEKPGPWANLLGSFHIDVFKLGPLFIAFGVLWLLWLYAFLSGLQWSYSFGIIISILTLWYLPVGTVFSLVILFTLLLARAKLGV
jgi:hypothetical protein